MRRSYRCIILALVGCLISAASPSREETGGEQAKAERAIAESLRGIDASLKNANEPSIGAQPCKPGRDERESDLCAQWKAADAAAGSALWTERTFYLGIGSAFVGLLTLAAAVAAAKFARDAAYETRRGADTANATYSAFVAIERPKIIVAIDGFGFAEQSTKLSVDMKVTNIGKSMCIVTGIYWEWQADAAFIDGGTLQGPSRHEPVLASDSKILGFVVRHDQSHPFVRGVVEYDSPLRRGHASYFCFKVIPEREGLQVPHAWIDARGAGWPVDT